MNVNECARVYMKASCVSMGSRDKSEAGTRVILLMMEG